MWLAIGNVFLHSSENSEIMVLDIYNLLAIYPGTEYYIIYSHIGMPYLLQVSTSSTRENFNIIIVLYCAESYESPCPTYDYSNPLSL